MDSARSGNICRRFINGFCRFGLSCKYRHEITSIPASQICRYFQKGVCWYGERCRFFHILLPQVGPAFSGRRGSVPAASSSVTHPLERRGSEPALWRATFPSRQKCSGSHSAVYASNPQQDTGHLPEYIVEEQSQDYVEPAQSSGIAQASAWLGRHEGPSRSETREGGATAACNKKSGEEETLASLRSKNVVCGICMEKVYEKENPRDRVFGILPNCNHPFCFECITTWRKTRDIAPDVVRTCPQCRVRSAFYVPNKYWVEGQEKENVIDSFKKRFSKKRCHYLDRYRCCPFKEECLYRHGSDSDHTAFSYISHDIEDEGLNELLGFFMNTNLLDSEDQTEDLLFFLYEDIRF